MLKKLGKSLTGLGKSSSTSSSEPWKAQQPFIKQGFSDAQNWLNSNRNPNQSTQAGWDMQRDSALSGFGGAVDSSQNLNSFFSNQNLLSPEGNPYMAENINALGRNITQQADRNNNTINQQAAQAGGFGGRRQGVAQGLNAEAATNAFADGTSRMVMDNYNQRMSQMQAQQQFLPQLAQMSMMPGMVMEDVGNKEANRAMDNLARYWSIVGSNNWGGTTTGTQTASPIQNFQGVTQGLKNLSGFALPGG